MKCLKKDTLRVRTASMLLLSVITTINSGKVKLSSPAYCRVDEPEFNIGAGVYKLTIRSLNSGKEDPDAVEDLEDQEFFKLEHLERYELYFEPKA